MERNDPRSRDELVGRKHGETRSWWMIASPRNDSPIPAPRVVEQTCPSLIIAADTYTFARSGTRSRFTWAKEGTSELTRPLGSVFAALANALQVGPAKSAPTRSNSATACRSLSIEYAPGYKYHGINSEAATVNRCRVLYGSRSIKR